MAKKASDNKPWMVATIILGVLLLVSLLLNAVVLTLMAVGSDGAPTPTAPSPSGQPTAPSGPVDVSADDDPFQGNPDADVVVIEFSDYECPFCARFWSDTYPTIKEDYIDTGKIKFVYRDFPLENIHRRALPAAVAAECVAELEGDEAYFEMHDLLFQNNQALSDDDLRAYALEIGVDGDAFDECVADEDMAAEVRADLRAGQQAGVSGTPTFFINGEKIVGAQPASVFTAALDAALNE